jgi:casein kinase 1
MEMNIPTKLAGGRFEVAEQLGAGCFGAVYTGRDNKRSGKPVAIKFEFPECAAAGALANEDRMMRALQTPELQQGYAEVFWYGKSRGNASLVMELLGKSLEDTMEACKGQMPVNSVVLVAAQAIMRIEYLHSRGIVHRDIKPENFMWGIQDKVHHLYLIDFGMCTTYFDKTHLPVRSEASLVGTARYASINTHELKTQSRRDDLEAIGHVLFYLLRGKLPWSGLKAKTDEEKYRKIGEVKKTTPVADLCKGYPQEFARYLQYSRALQWEERPDYERLHQLVRSVREQVGPLDPHELEWLPEDLDVGSLTAIRTWNELDIKQPDDVQSENIRRTYIGGDRGISRRLSRAKCWWGTKVPMFRGQPAAGGVAIRQSGQIRDTE